MATVGERLATLEQIARDNRADIKAISDLLSGEGDIPYDRSVRGRLHKIETTLAGMVLRRNYGVGLLKGWERFALVLCGVATVAASWYHVVFG
jgi:hypothetical protein